MNNNNPIGERETPIGNGQSIDHNPINQNQSVTAPRTSSRSRLSFGRIFSCFRGERNNVQNRISTQNPINIPRTSSSEAELPNMRVANNNSSRRNLISRLFGRHRQRPSQSESELQASRINDLSKYLNNKNINQIFSDSNINHKNIDKILTTLEDLLPKLDEKYCDGAAEIIINVINRNPDAGSQFFNSVSKLADKNEDHSIKNNIILNANRMIYFLVTNTGYTMNSANWNQLETKKINDLFKDEHGNDSEEILKSNINTTRILATKLDSNDVAHFRGNAFYSIIKGFQNVENEDKANLMHIPAMDYVFNDSTIPENDNIEELKTITPFFTIHPILNTVSVEEATPILKAAKNDQVKVSDAFTKINSVISDVINNVSGNEQAIIDVLKDKSSLECAVLRIILKSHETLPQVSGLINKILPHLVGLDDKFTLKAITDKEDASVIDFLNSDSGKKWYDNLKNSSHGLAFNTVQSFIKAHVLELPDYAFEVTFQAFKSNDILTVTLMRDQLPSNISKVLQTLNSHLTPIPETLSVFFEGEKGADQGGLSRDFISLVHENFVKNYKDNTLWKGEEKSKNECIAMGKLMAFSIANEGEMPMGKQLDREVFARLQMISPNKELSMTDKLRIFKRIEVFDQRTLNQFINFLEDTGKITENSRSAKFIKYMQGLGMYDTIDKYQNDNGSLNWDLINENLSAFKESLFNEFNEHNSIDNKVLPLYYIKQGLVADKSMSEIIESMAPEQLDIAIQGEINPSVILNTLEFNNIPLPQQDAIKKWIRAANGSQLENLLKHITGSPSLGKDIKITFIGFHTDEGKMDNAHTCFNALDVNLTIIDTPESMKNFLDDIGEGKSEKTYNRA